MERKCSIGFMSDTDCHMKTYSKNVGIESMVDLESNMREIIMWRAGLTILNIDATICFHHKYVFLKRFSMLQKKCCNPYKLHCSSKKGSLRTINLQMAKDLCSTGYYVIPGQKLCPQCRSQTAMRKENGVDIDIEIDVTDPNDNEIFTYEQDVQLDLTRESLNSTLGELDLSPLKVHSVASHSKPSLGKRKLKQVEGAFSKKLASVLKVNEADIETCSKSDIDQEIQEKADDLDFLVQCMKEKLKLATRRKRLQILTLVPNSWSVRKAAEEFSVAKSTIQKARLLRNQRGIIECPDTVKRNKLSQDIINTVKDFYCDDQFSRQLPGKKDYVSIEKNKHMSKRLILCNLKELYTAYKLKYSNYKIRFSKFASLRPKWCILVGPKGTHSVCVCTIHQNVKLMLSAINLQKSYHDLIEMMVCDRNSNICMIHRCENCPGIEPVEQYLSQYLMKNNFEFSDDNDSSDEFEEVDIDFKQWTTTDRTALTSMKLPLNEFISLLCEKMNKITAHSFIAKSQSNYLTHLKEKIDTDEAIVLGDFAENYSFVVQDEIQGYHWNKSQCSLHPVVVYFRSSDSLADVSLCILSDDLDHDVSFVFKVLQETVAYIKKEVNPKISKIHYFSDGCAAQYKNCKHFINLCHHKSDFSVDCVWNFFATSHGKSPCDGIGGTVKRLTARASLQRPINDQILSAKDMLKFCKDSIHGIKFLYAPSKEIINIRNSLATRFSLARTVPGTRIYHQFMPSSDYAIKMKRISQDNEFELEFNFLVGKTPEINNDIKNIRVSQYLLCRYDKEYWIGMASEIDPVAKDVKVKFMHPHYPSRSYRWPVRDDDCWVPKTHLVTTINTPYLSSASGRQYHILADDIEAIEKLVSI